MAWTAKKGNNVNEGAIANAPALSDIMSEELARKFEQEEQESITGISQPATTPQTPPPPTIQEANEAGIQAHNTNLSVEEAERFVADEELARKLQQQENDLLLAFKLSHQTQTAAAEEEKKPQQQKQHAPQCNERKKEAKQKGVVVTKHDPEVAARRNAEKLGRWVEEDGDIASEGISIPTATFNALKEHSRRDEIRTARKKESHSGGSPKKSSSRKPTGKDARSDAVLDDNTRLTILGLMNNGVCEQLGGVVGQGKEARVFHSIHKEDDEAKTTNEVAIKVFRSSGELRSRIEYADKGLLSELQRDKPHAWRIVRLWAQRELKTLTKLSELNSDNSIHSPKPIGLYGGNVLVMQFLGIDGVPFPTLHDAAERINKNKATMKKIFIQIIRAMRVMFIRCGIIHADLSEFNILYDKRDGGNAWIIDVAQSVSAEHRNATSFLRRDCASINAFFRRLFFPGTLSAKEIFVFVTDKNLTVENELNRLDSLVNEVEKRGTFNSREQIIEDESFAKSEFGNPEIPEAPSAIIKTTTAAATTTTTTTTSEDLEISTLASNGEEDDEVLEFLSEQLSGGDNSGFPLGKFSDGTVILKEHRRLHIESCFPRIRELGMSIVARINNEICGVVLMDDLSAPSPIETSKTSSEWLKTIGPIAELNSAAKKPVFERWKNKTPGEIAYISWVGVSDSARSHGLMKKMILESLEIAKVKGYSHALIVCVNEFARKSALGIGFNEVFRVEYSTFEIAKMPSNGLPGKPFINVPAPHTAAVTMHLQFTK